MAPIRKQFEPLSNPDPMDITILVVEDDQGVNRLITKQLQRAGFQTLSAFTGEEALEKAVLADRVLMLMDFRLPDITAREVLDELEKSEQKIPFIIMTGYGDEELAVEMMQQGALDYLVKTDQFLDLISQKIQQACFYLVEQQKATLAEQRMEESEKRYRSLFNSIRDAILITDTDRNIVQCNPAFVDMFGYSLEEIQGKKTHYVYSNGEDFKKMGDLLRQNAGDREIRLTVRFQKKTGEIFPCETSAFYLRDTRDQIIGYIGLIRDVSDKLAQEEALKQSEAHFRNIWNKAHEPMRLMGADGIIRDVNPAFCQLMKMSREEVIGHPFTRVYQMDHPERVLEEYKKDFKERTIAPFCRSEVQIHSGESLFLDISNSFEKYNGEEILLMSVLRDVTARKRLEAELFHSQKMETLGQIAGGIAHDFNNALAALSGAVEMIQVQSGDRVDEKYFSMVHSRIEQARSITERLLTFTHKSNPRLEQVSLNKILEDLRELASHTLPPEIEIQVTPTQGLDLVYADKNQIQQVGINLCINAVQAIEDRGIIALEVRPPSREEQKKHSAKGQYLCLTVTDSGRGMSPEMVEKIFDPFYTTKGEEGTGLGLTIIQKIVDNHRGWIDVKSTPGEGTTFVIGFPCAGTEITGRDGKEESLIGKGGEGEHILVVEDDPSLSNLLADFLEAHNFKVTQAKDGLAGVEVFEENPEKFQLILTDLGLPKINGIEMAEKIRKISRETPMIAATGYVDHERQQQLKSVGFQMVLKKPFQLKKVLSAIQDLTAKKEPR